MQGCHEVKVSRFLPADAEIKMDEKFMEEKDEFEPFLGKILRIDTEKHELPLYGRLISISEQFLTLQRRDGRLTLIKRKAIVGAEPTTRQEAV